MNSIKSAAHECKLLNCNCWYVVDTMTNTLIYRGDNYDEANTYRLAQSDATSLKMTPWTHGRELVSREAN